VRDAGGQQIAYVYFECEPSRRSAAKLLSKDEGGGLRPILPSTLGNMLADMYAGTHIQVSGEPVEEQWKTFRRSLKKAWRGIYLVAAPKNAECVGL